MAPSSRSEILPPIREARRVWVAATILVAAVWLAYANSLNGPFVYDDKPSTVYNASIRHLWPPGALFHPPGAGATVSGRPVLNISLALNFALSGDGVRGYHITNVLIHMAAALVLFGLLRRLFLAPGSSPLLGHQATGLAVTLSAIWALHPLQTEAVSYIVQRAESLMGFFYLSTVYAVVRSIGNPRSPGWPVLAWLTCLLGMATKENMISAPVIILLVDRAFFAGSFRAAWAARWRLYGMLGLTMLMPFALLLTTGGNRGGSVGFDVGVGWGAYLLTQFPAIERYLQLVLWPSSLVFDYGAFTVASLAAIARPVLLTTSAVALAIYALWRHPRTGVAGALMFAVLAPTSLVPGTTQMIVEHRMYLPLAGLAGLGAALAWLGGRTAVLAGSAMAVALGITTAARNRVYQDEATLWRDTAAKRPANPIAWSSLGSVLGDRGLRGEAMVAHRRALDLNPNYAPALANLGLALTESGKPDQALPLLTRALQLLPNRAQTHLNLAIALELLGRSDEALPELENAVRLNPLLAEAHNDLAEALTRAGRIPEAISHLHEALTLRPNYLEANLNLATALARAGRMEEARNAFASGAAARANDATVYITWANELRRLGHGDEALDAYRHAVSIQPESAEVHYAYATGLAALDQFAAAVPIFETALRIRPDYAEAHNNLGNTLLSLNRAAEAIPHYEAALRQRPDDARTHNNLGLALARSGRVREAESHFAKAVDLDPRFDDAQQNLARARLQLRAFGG